MMRALMGRLAVAALAAILSLALVDMALRAPALRPGFAPPPGPLADRARLALDAKDYALARAWDAAGAGDGAAAAGWARASLAEGPRNGYAWLALAWGEALAGREGAARAALERSYRLAPRSTPLAVSRSLLAQRWWPVMTPPARARLLEEVRVARGLDAHAFNRAAEETPRLSVLHQLGQGVSPPVHHR